MSRKSILGIIIFFVIAISLRYLTNKTDLIITYINSEFLKIIITAIGPTIGVLVAVKIFNLKFPMSLKGNYKKLLIPFLLFWALPLIIITTKAYFLKGNFALTTVFAILVYGLLEEIGWRGFLYEQLKPLPKFVNILIVTVLWFIWHLNFELSLSNLIFFLILLLGSWGIALVADKTKSLLAVASFHSLNNFYSEWNSINLLIIGTLVLIWILALVYHPKKELKNGS
ncbi:CPBP family intramembrane glutamic endopeptidase [Mesonia hippocampi]|uniref:CPBP family intramembrane glutamic endopeptidase n=1 Tax=Mesonia hippocampi TaxID=1628250 RepID=UPI003F9E7C59